MHVHTHTHTWALLTAQFTEQLRLDQSMGYAMETKFLSHWNTIFANFWKWGAYTNPNYTKKLLFTIYK